VFTKPEMIYANKRFQLDNLHTKIIKNQQILQNNIRNKLSTYLTSLKNQINNNVIKINSKLKVYTGKLDALGPNGVLSRGYAIIRQDTKAISNINQIKLDKEVDVIMKDGKLIVKPIKKG
jgi:exonuclease VII large subunit